MTLTDPSLTLILNRACEGDSAAREEVLPLIHDELHNLARRHLARLKPSSSLEPTLLLNDAYLRLVHKPGYRWKNVRSFYAFASKVMHGMLVDHLRHASAEKRGGDRRRVAIDEALDLAAPSPDMRRLLLDDALEKLQVIKPCLSEVARMRIGAGLTVREIAGELDQPLRTVERRWHTALAWLRKELRQDD